MINIRLNSIYHRLVAISLLICTILFGVLLLELIISARAEAKTTLEQKIFEYQKLSNIIADRDIHAKLNKDLRDAIQTSQSIIHLKDLTPDNYAEETVQKLTHSLNRKGIDLMGTKTSFVDIGYGVKQLSVELEAAMPHRSLHEAVFVMEAMQREGVVADFHLSRLNSVVSEKSSIKMMLEYRLYLDTLN